MSTGFPRKIVGAPALVEVQDKNDCRCGEGKPCACRVCTCVNAVLEPPIEDEDKET